MTSGRGGKLRTPKHSFFKAAKNGEQLDLGRMPVGGRLGKPPVKTAFESSLPQMRRLLPVEMTLALNKAVRDKADKYSRRRKARK